MVRMSGSLECCVWCVMSCGSSNTCVQSAPDAALEHEGAGLLTNVDLSGNPHADLSGKSTSESLDWVNTPLRGELPEGRLASASKSGPDGGIPPFPTATAPPAPAEPRPTGLAASLCACFTLQYYSKLFNVDTVDVVLRLRRAAWPFFSQSFFETIGDNPDLYGPVWICTTLVFVIGVASNLSSWVALPTGKEGTWTYDFSLVTQAASVVLGFAVVVPILIWGVLLHFNVPMKFVKLACLYGYSVVTFLPAAVLCTTPSAALDWLVVAIAMGLSSALLVANVYPALNEHAAASSKLLAAFLAGTQVAFGFTLKVFFFKKVSS